MAFNPTIPVEDSPLDAVEICAQFNALKALMDAQAAQIADLTNACANFVTAGDVDHALLSGSAGNCDAVAKLNLTVSSPPTQDEVQTIANKQDEVIRFLQRQ